MGDGRGLDEGWLGPWSVTLFVVYSPLEARDVEWNICLGMEFFQPVFRSTFWRRWFGVVNRKVHERFERDIGEQ